MTDLCVRCAHLFAECRPLLGASCPKAAHIEPPRLDLPETDAEPEARAAVVANSRTGDFEIRPIRVVDFFKDRP